MEIINPFWGRRQMKLFADERRHSTVNTHTAKQKSKCKKAENNAGARADIKNVLKFVIIQPLQSNTK